MINWLIVKESLVVSLIKTQYAESIDVVNKLSLHYYVSYVI